MTTQPNPTIHAYIEAFCAGDTKALSTLLADDFTFEGTLQQFDNKKDFIAETQDAQAIAQGHTLLLQAPLGDDKNPNDILSTYEFHIGAPAKEASVTMTSINRVVDDKIVASRLFFNPETFMALMPPQED